MMLCVWTFFGAKDMRLMGRIQSALNVNKYVSSTRSEKDRRGIAILVDTICILLLELSLKSPQHPYSFGFMRCFSWLAPVAGSLLSN